MSNGYADPPKPNEDLSAFEKHYAEQHAKAMAQVEAAIKAFVGELEGGNIPAMDDMIVHGQMVSIQGWESVTFFVWKKEHALAYVIEPDESGKKLHPRIMQLARDKWPAPLVKFVERKDPQPPKDIQSN